MRFGSLGVVATVAFDDGTVASTPDDDRPFDRLCFERRFGFPWAEWDTLLEEYLLFMAWVQLNRAALADKSLALDAFDAWAVTVASITVEPVSADDEDVDVNPTTPRPPTA